jgi:hypothetical protein
LTCRVGEGPAPPEMTQTGRTGPKQHVTGKFLKAGPESQDSIEFVRAGQFESIPFRHYRSFG